MITHLLELLFSGIGAWWVAIKAYHYERQNFALAGLLTSESFLISAIVATCLTPVSILLRDGYLSLTKLTLLLLIGMVALAFTVIATLAIKEVIDELAAS